MTYLGFEVPTLISFLLGWEGEVYLLTITIVFPQAPRLYYGELG